MFRSSVSHRGGYICHYLGLSWTFPPNRGGLGEAEGNNERIRTGSCSVSRLDV